MQSATKSTFIWILGLFALANVSWGFLHPLQAVPHTSQPNLELSKAALRYKMDKLSQSKTPDVLIIGSSLPMCAFFYTEAPPYFDLNEGDRIRQQKLNLLQSYPKAGYFHAALQEQTKKDLEVFNFAGAACMVSDTKLVMERCLAAHKKPKVLIYGLGLRDFVDNVNPPPGETPYYKALCNLGYVANHLLQLTHVNAFTELSMSALCRLYDLRNEFRITAEHFACTTFHHPSSIELAFMLGDLNRQLQNPTVKKALAPAPAATAVSSTTDPTKDTANTTTATTAVEKKADASGPPAPRRLQESAPKTTTPSSTTGSPAPTLSVLDYPQRYTPANYSRLEQEMKELREMIAFCKKNQIQLVLMNMPVSQGHKTLSPPGLRDEYLKELRSTAKDADLFLDFEDANLPDSDFFDTVHLNGDGAKRFVDGLSKKLVESGITL